jgi:glucuronyl/N-acetylglucosaminyl transferase EXT1
VIIADGSLANFERALNQRTISMPALPMVREAAADKQRDVLASFQGAASHPVRRALARLHDGKDFIINLVEPSGYSGRIDQESGVTDRQYELLLDRSIFAFVPRGDALFSYRLLEVMARGAIPVILSDGWVLPFNRLIDWSTCSIVFPHEAVHRIPDTLRAFTPDEIGRMQQSVREVYVRFFTNLDRIIAALFDEAASVLK